MKIVFSDALKGHLQNRKKRNIVVEVATTDHSDFDVTEIFTRFCDNRHRDYLREKRGYREYPIEGVSQDHMAVLFKPYRLEFEEEIRFDIAKKWIFSKIVFDGIKL